MAGRRVSVSFIHYHNITYLLLRCHTLAEQTGAVLIPCCGFDSIPSDISAYLSNRTLKENSSDAALDSSVTAIQAKGGISGGTMDTMFTIMEDVPPKLRSASIKSFSFSPGMSFRSRLRACLTIVHLVRGVRQVTFNFLYSLPLYPHITGGYYFMTVCNRLVVQRTWGLGQVELAAKKDDAGAQSRAYGPRFAYSEFMSVPGGKIGGFIVSALTLLFGLLVAISPVRYAHYRTMVVHQCLSFSRFVPSSSASLFNPALGHQRSEPLHLCCRALSHLII
jgi:hypothetical protein